MNLTDAVPRANYGLIGGSGTWGTRFPEDLDRDDVEVIEIFDQGFETPYGRSIPYKLLKVEGERVLRVAMHGVRYGERNVLAGPPWVASRQVAAVFQAAGVKWALVEGSVGGIQSPDNLGEPLPPWSAVVTDDFLMLWRPPDDIPFIASREKATRLREPFCTALRQVLFDTASKESRFAAVHDHGVYARTPAGRFETSAEIAAFAGLGAHIVGMTLGHEAPLMRQLGIHFASLNIVSNYAEGTTERWVGDDAAAMSAFYFDCAPVVGNVMIEALKEVIGNGRSVCNCDNYYLDLLDAFPVSGA